MITREQYEVAQKRAKGMLDRAGIVLAPQEVSRIEVADLGLSDLEHIGVELVVYVNTERVCAKELVLFPRQICPEHRHPPVGKDPGKEETFRCRWGVIYLHIPGKDTPHLKAVVPAKYRSNFTVWNEIVLNPGDQYTLPPNTWHWFQGGEYGAIVSEFSTRSRDETDLFTDPKIKRQTAITD